MTRPGSISDSPPASGSSAAATFGAIWDALVDVLGSAAAATLVRRAIKEARAAAPGLDDLEIARERFEYRYAVPSTWTGESPAAMADLRTLVRHLEPLLQELTGAVVILRLRALPELANSGLFGREVEP